MTDPEALELGRELAELCHRADDMTEHQIISLGRVAVKLCEPYVLEMNREPSEEMCQAGYDAAASICDDERHTWRAMIDARIRENGAEWELARFLRNTMERLDPTGSGAWEDLPFEERAFYRDVILDLIEARELIERAWKSQTDA